MKPETQTDRDINEGSSQSPILTKVYLLIQQLRLRRAAYELSYMLFVCEFVVLYKNGYCG